MDKILSELTIEIIQKCANSCLFCSSLSGRISNHIISQENVINIGVQAKKLGLNSISISGGEPLLHPDVKHIVSELTSLGLSVSIYTTGIVLDDFRQSQAFHEWDGFEKDSVRLIFGLQSSSEIVHDAITQNKRSFFLTKESMFAAQRQGFPIEIHIVPNKINLPSLSKSVDDFLSWGIERISFLRLVPQGYARKNRNALLLDEKETKVLKNLFSQLNYRCNSHDRIRLGIPFSGIMNSPRTCNAGESKLIIRYDGKVLPCEAFKDEGFNNFILGDIEKDSLKELLEIAGTNTNLFSLKKLINAGETCPAQFLYL